MWREKTGECTTAGGCQPADEIGADDRANFMRASAARDSTKGARRQHPAWYLILAALAVLIVMSAPREPLQSAVDLPPRVPSKLAIESELLHRGPVVPTPQLGSLAVHPLAGGRLLAAWVGFPGESGQGGEVALARFDARQWSVPRVVVRIEDLGRGAGQRFAALEGVTLHVDRSGFVHLFVASRVVGDLPWSNIDHLRSVDGGHTFSHVQRLPLAPLLNGSHSVGAPAINLRGGGFVLPVHYAWGSNYGVLLSFDAQGRLTQRSRLDGPPKLADPWPIVHSAKLVEFYMREVSGEAKVWVGRLDRSEPTRPLNWRLGAPGLSALPSFDGTSWVARVSENAPEQLVLQRMNALHQAANTLLVAKGSRAGVYSDPRLAQTDDGRIHLLYVDRGRAIGHRVYRATGL